MASIKKLFQSYIIKLLAILIITCLISWIFKAYILSGIILFVLTLYVFTKSFKDPIFKRKKIISKILIYSFIAIFLICGILTTSGNPNKSTNVLRREIEK